MSIKFDWRYILPIIGTVISKTKTTKDDEILAQAVKLHDQYGGIIDPLIADLIGSLKKHQDSGGKIPLPTTITVPKPPAGVTIGPNPTASLNPTSMPAIVGIQSAGDAKSCVRYISNGGDVMDKGSFDAVLAGVDAIGAKTKVHYNVSPVDAAGGEVKPGDPRLKGFYVDAWVEGASVDQFGQPDNLAQTGDEEDHGCTPVAHIGQSINGRASFRVKFQGMLDGQPVGQPIYSAEITVA